MGFLALSLLAPGFALSQEDSSGDRVSASAQESEQPADPAETEWQPTYQYMALPPSATPLNSLLPFGGIGASPSLMKTNKGQVFSHDINIATRELDVSEKHVNGVSRDTTTLWTAHYPELTDYVSDMYDVGRKNLWLNGLVGQKDDGYEAPETGSMFDITIPVTMPAWMRDFGLDKPKLMLQGTMDIRLKGYGEKDDAEGSTKTSLWPSPTLTYDPSFMVKGKIGPYITVEINNVESGLGVQNQVRVVYEESYKDEFEDYILQRVEAGTTSLSLTGTELTGYSENHQGLFGIKAEWKLGDWRLTTIASQDGGSQEEYTINASETTTEFQVLDKQFIAYRYSRVEECLHQCGHRGPYYVELPGNQPQALQAQRDERVEGRARQHHGHVRDSVRKDYREGGGTHGGSTFVGLHLRFQDGYPQGERREPQYAVGRELVGRRHGPYRDYRT